VNLKLTEEQQEVVDHTLGPALVFAVAGAGKTTAMVHRIEKLVRENVFPPERILATSFAKSNVNDLKDALRAWPHCRPVEVRTLHSLGLNIVRLAQQEGHLPYLAFGDNDEESGSVDQQLLTLAQGQARQLNMPFVKELDSLDRQDFLDYVGSCKSNLLYADLQTAKLPPTQPFDRRGHEVFLLRFSG
jgi:DNA helicase-2/ATP-dependent DNA helicase PcrA